MIEETATDALPQKKTINHYLRKWYYGILYWVRLHIWYRYCYRHVMKLLHKFNLHYTTVVMPFEKDDVFVPSAFSSDRKYKKQQLWCQWCGLRGDILKISDDH
jgi:hypothetical protein